MLRLHDTATASVRPLELREPGRVSMYVCGPTVYEVPHLGHGRFALVFDVLRRYLAFRGLEVRHVSNVTDIDDHIIARAAQEGRTEVDVAAEYEARWWEAMDAIDVLRPVEVPHATAYVAHMVALVDDLVGRGAAYETGDGVYMRAESVGDYGLLKHQPLDELRAGARVETLEEKRSPLDFALWKKAKPGEPSWPSPWGEGRPGWHTECVVMSLDLLGEGFDLHGGGQDLIFPHHENERAQAVARDLAFARHWVHNGWVTVGGEKMSKSLRNFTTIADMLAAGDARAYRLLVLRSHYRSPIEVSEATAADAERALGRLDGLARRLSLPDVLAGAPGGVVVRVAAAAASCPAGGAAAGPAGAAASSPAGGAAAGPAGGAAADVDEVGIERFCERMDDDLDTPAALGGIFDLVGRAHAAADDGRADEAARLGATVAMLAGALGLRLRGGTAEVDPETQRLVAERDEARAARDWARADELRDRLRATGWIVEDGPEGSVVHR